MIKLIEGDLLDAKEDIIAHQSNTRGVWGAGLARELRAEYPDAYKWYKRVCEEYGDNLLGTCWVIDDGNKYIANLFGQTGYGRDKNIVYTSYHALETALRSLNVRSDQDELSVALPWGLGCGLANGDWNIVYKIIDRVFEETEVTLYRLKQSQ